MANVEDEWFVSVYFDQTVVPTHPKTGERIPPPECVVAICSEESVGWTKARLVSLVNSTGWHADFEERPVLGGERCIT